MSARAAIVALALAAAGCSFQRRSEGYACETSSECGAGRACDQGWCVEVGGPTIDADPNAPDADPTLPDGAPADAFVCPAGCDFCDEVDICHITCNTSDVGAPCNASPVLCPPGAVCKIECLAGDSCAAGVDCTDSANCRIECTGIGSCGGPLDCSDGPCHVECTATGTCTGGIDCADSCSCFVQCAGGACTGTTTCPAGCQAGNECRNNQQECSTCAGG